MSSAATPSACRRLATALYVVGFLALLDTLVGNVPWIHSGLEFLFSWIIPLPIIDWFSALVLLVLATGLGRRKRVAWAALLTITLVLLVIYGLTLGAVTFLSDSVTFETANSSTATAATTDPLSDTLSTAELTKIRLLMMGALTSNIAVLLGLLALLLRYRRYYTVRSLTTTYRGAFLVFVGGSAVVAAIGLCVLAAFRGSSPATVLALFKEPHDPQWLYSAMGFGWAVCALAAMWLLMQAQHRSAVMSTQEELRLRELLATHPSDSLGYFATRRDKSALVTEQGAVAYRASLGVALASGDPLGPPSTWPATAQAFLAHAAEFGLTPAVVGLTEAGARAYVRAGLKAVRLGDEAVLKPSHFRLSELPEVRRAARHITNLGYTVRIRRHRDIPHEQLLHLASLAQQWLGGEEERGFSMALSRLADASDGECLMVEALFPPSDPRGEVAALLSFVPWGADGLSLDVMRRHPDVDNGVTEFMVASLMAESHDLEITQVSLNFVVFRSTFDKGARIGASFLRRSWYKALLFASRWWQLESLYRSNQKYSPEWSPRLICYPDGADLPRVLLALGVAEGFVPLPLPTAQAHRSEEEAQQLGAASSAAVPHRPAPTLPAEVHARLDMRQRMLEAGEEPYPASVHVTTSCAAAAALAGATPDMPVAAPDNSGIALGTSDTTTSSAPLSADAQPSELVIAGRILSIRDHGGVVFASMRDWSGDVQILLNAQDLPAQVLNSFRATVRSGDQIAVTGRPGRSRNGTPSVLAQSWQMTSKALRPLPDKHRGLKDPEARVRQRHLTLITSPAARDMLRARSHAIQAVRQTLLDRGYLEVETPMLHPVHGGANARPFRTHINAYDLDLYLRIAPELYLKRLMVAGADRVFEIGRSFRNEGADSTHNPEFTMVEAYQAYADYEVMKGVVQDLVVRAAQAAVGSTIIRGRVGSDPDGEIHEIDLAAPWRTVSVCDAVAEHLGDVVDVSTPLSTLHAFADSLDLSYDPAWGWGTMVQHLYEHLAEGTTAEPTFFTDFPEETSPLTRPHRRTPGLAERWDLIIFGSEVGTAYSELVDPVIQRERLTAQSLAATGGDPEAMELDEAFLQALEAGMPPTGGLGVGLDRLVMMLTQSSIRETITFPLVRPEQ